MNKNVWATILKVAIAIATALLGALGTAEAFSNWQ